MQLDSARYILSDMNSNQDGKKSAQPLLQVDQHLCFALYSANLAMHKIYRQQLAELRITYPQYLVMLVLWHQDDISVSEIGEQLFLDSATLTPLLKRLESAGLVRRQRSRQDERQVAVTLTYEGRELQTRAAAIPEAIQCAAACDSETLAALKQQLDLLRTNLNRAE